jgi:hypothetical protein
VGANNNKSTFFHGSEIMGLFKGENNRCYLNLNIFYRSFKEEKPKPGGYGGIIRRITYRHFPVANRDEFTRRKPK